MPYYVVKVNELIGDWGMPALRPATLVHNQQNTVAPIHRPQIFAAQLINQCSFKFAESHVIRNFDLNGQSGMGCLSRNDDIWLFRVSTFGLPINPVAGSLEAP